MKLIDSINRIRDVKYSHWDARNERLVVYYGDYALKDAIHIRVIKYLTDTQIKDSVKTLTLISGA